MSPFLRLWSDSDVCARRRARKLLRNPQPQVPKKSKKRPKSRSAPLKRDNNPLPSGPTISDFRKIPQFTWTYDDQLSVVPELLEDASNRSLSEPILTTFDNLNLEKTIWEGEEDATPREGHGERERRSYESDRPPLLDPRRKTFSPPPEPAAEWERLPRAPRFLRKSYTTLRETAVNTTHTTNTTNTSATAYTERRNTANSANASKIAADRPSMEFRHPRHEGSYSNGDGRLARAEGSYTYSKMAHSSPPRPIQMPPRDLPSISRIDASLVFEQFTTTDAWDLGCALRSRLLPLSIPVVIDISLANACQTLFRCSTQSGTTPDNELWVRRKRKTVLRWGVSTWYMWCKFEGDEKAFAGKYGLGKSGGEYAIQGGGVPIRVMGVEGIVGVVVVSGLKQHEDHAVIVEVIKDLYY